MLNLKNRYINNEEGNVAILMGLVSSILLLGVAAALETNSLVSTKSYAQDRLDSAVLSAASTHLKSLSLNTRSIVSDSSDVTQDFITSQMPDGTSLKCDA